MTDTLTERELLAWWRQRDEAAPLFQALGEITDRVATQDRVNHLSDLVTDQVMLDQDEMLFHAGTLCLLNGQRALWSQIYYLFLSHEGDMPEEDEFEFLDRMSSEARAAINSSDPPPEPTAAQPAATVEQAIYARLAALGGPEARRLLDLLARLQAQG